MVPRNSKKCFRAVAFVFSEGPISRKRIQGRRNMFPHVERIMKKGLPYGVGPRDPLKTPAEDHTGQNTDTASMKLEKKLLR